MRLYTVLLLYPDYIAEDYGQETYQAFILGGESLTTDEAILLAQQEASEGNNDNPPEDFLPLFVTYGHHENLLN